MRHPSTKHGYIISHSTRSKSAAESGPPHNGAAAETPSIIDFLTLLDLLRGASTLLSCFQWDLRDGVTRDRDCRASKLSTWDSCSPCGASTADV
jgi:hypothetical protein